MKYETAYDVIVCGAGPGGCCAAINAARNGMKTLLIERYGFAGGMATAGLVNPFMAYVSNKGKNLTNRIFREIIAELEKRGAIDMERKETFDDEVLKIVLDEMLLNSGVSLLFHSQLCGASVSNGRIDSIQVLTKSGFKEFKAKVFIDGTGDGDLAYYAGFKYEQGRSLDGACQPSTLCFRIGGITWEHHFYAKSQAAFLEGKAEGIINNPRENLLMFKTLKKDIYHYNTTRIVGRNGVLSDELTDAELSGRRQALEVLECLKKKVPEFYKDAYIIKIAAQIGIRETRRVNGLYKITEDDVVHAKIFDDGIARSNYPLDIHNPAGTGTLIKYVEGEFYEIPYRSLIPESSKNLIMACRAISSTHEAHSSFRVMPVVASYGEAAGLAAAWAVKKAKIPSELDGTALKKEILD